MAQPLKHRFGPEVPGTLGGMLAAAHTGFDTGGFLELALKGYDALELMPRARHLSHSLRPFLPSDGEEAIRLVTRAAEPELQGPRRTGMDAFRYLPLTLSVAEYGLDHFEASMRAQHVLTRLFTAEFSIRPFLEHHPEPTLARFQEWAGDRDPHVRGLVSEGTRPRLPWAPRLSRFVEDPEPVLHLLERLRDDPALYVRRSVANNLNDIAKDHPEKVLATSERWMRGANTDRKALVRHALRTLVKKGDSRALAILGFGWGSPVEVATRLVPDHVSIGESLRVELTLRNPGEEVERVAVDLRVHFVGADGTLRPKVFKGSEVTLEPWGTRSVRRTISLRQHTTRTHHPGRHTVEVQVNGETRRGGDFELREAAGSGPPLEEESTS
jgi:3-methyladenine DNA glycosylase AlkC